MGIGAQFGRHDKNDTSICVEGEEEESIIHFLYTYIISGKIYASSLIYKIQVGALGDVAAPNGAPTPFNIYITVKS